MNIPIPNEDRNNLPGIGLSVNSDSQVAPPEIAEWVKQMPVASLQTQFNITYRMGELNPDGTSYRRIRLRVELSEWLTKEKVNL